MFSVITVCHNDLENLRRTAASVEAQEFGSVEYVVWDGASGDGTREYLPQSGAHRWHSAPDGGIFDGMNKGLELCSGRYVHFLNAGDVFYDSEVLSSVAQGISDWPDAGLLYGDVLYPGSARPFSTQPANLTPFVLFRGTVCHQSWFVKREIYKALGGFDTRLRHKGDYDALLRMVYVLRVDSRHLPLCVAVYMGGGFSERTSGIAKPEFNAVRRKYLSKPRAAFYALVLGILGPVRSTLWFRRFRAAWGKRQAAWTWR
ncbi:MAG: glycosyltransferase family 2 protein [Terriglobia bacterium]